MKSNIIISGIVALLVAFGTIVLVGGNQPATGGSTSATWTAGNLVSNGTLSVTGASTFSGAITATGGATSLATTSVESFTQGGNALATSSTGTSETLAEGDLLPNSILSLTANTGNFTWTLPATSTMTTLIPNAGDCRTWLVENATTTAATTLTIAAGTGWNLIAVSNANDVIDGTEWAELTACRESDTDVVGIVSELLAAD